MKYLRIAFFIITLPALFLFVDYVLPSKEVVRVTDTYSRITDIGNNRLFYAQDDVVSTGNASTDTKRDIRFISMVTPEGKIKVIRNEDTGWVWPPYFKYDSANLQGEFASSASTSEAPKWVMVTKYGWRIPWLSIYPNAVAVTPVDSVDASTISVAALIVLALMFMTVFFLDRAYRRFKRRSIDPLLSDLDARTDAFRDSVAENADQKTKGLRDWIGTWQGKPRR